MADPIRTIDLSDLPQNAKEELLDFYHFLMQKYSKKGEKNKIDIKSDIFPQKVPTFTPLDREDIYAR